MALNKISALLSSLIAFCAATTLTAAPVLVPVDIDWAYNDQGSLYGAKGPNECLVARLDGKQDEKIDPAELTSLTVTGYGGLAYFATDVDPFIHALRVPGFGDNERITIPKGILADSVGKAADAAVNAFVQRESARIDAFVAARDKADLEFRRCQRIKFDSTFNPAAAEAACSRWAPSGQVFERGHLLDWLGGVQGAGIIALTTRNTPVSIFCGSYAQSKDDFILPLRAADVKDLFTIQGATANEEALLTADLDKALNDARAGLEAEAQMK